MHMPMIRGAVLVASLFLMPLALACGGSDDASDDGRDGAAGQGGRGGAGGSGGTGGSGGIGGSDGMDAGNDAAATDAADTDTAGDTAADGGMSSAMISLTDVTIYGNCMPIVPPDPITASWKVLVSGAAADRARLAKATLTIAGTSTGTQVLTVDKTTFPLSGGSGSAIQTKTAADTLLPDSCAAFCDPGTIFILDLTYDFSGKFGTVKEMGEFGCAF